MALVKQKQKQNKMNTPVIINRNGISKEFSETSFGKKSPNAGTKFWYPEFSESTFESDVKWFGMNELIDSMNTLSRRMFADIFTDNLDEQTGVFNEAQYLIDCAEFTAGVQKLSDIREQLDELSALQSSYVDDPQFGETDDAGVKTARALELDELIKKNNVQIKQLRVKKSTIEATYAARAEKREAKKSATEAAKKVNVAATA